jgi:thioredoxin reductase
MAVHQVCIIGAGSSGITAAKVLHDRAIPFDCFEKGSGIGGNWRYLNDNGMSSAYKSLHINTSRDRMCYSDFPMPRDYPDFPHHSQILAYFEAYVDHFGFRDKITFQTAVTHVSPVGDGTYNVTVNGPTGTRTERYGAVMVANGHHWCPNLPEFPGEFWGKSMHSHDYKTPEGMEDKNILVVGIGNSACDIACETSRIAKQTFLSTRHGAHVVPKYILGRPLDTYGTPSMAYLPLWVQRLLFKSLLFVARGSQSSYGFPTPKHPFLSEHPTISSDVLNLVGHGKIKMKPNLTQLKGDRVRFEDGTEEQIDAIIYATGYKVSFPFFDPSLINSKENEIPLYKRVVHPEHPTLYFIGLLQPLGPLMPLAELQSQWVAELLEGKVGLPSKEAMKRDIEKEREAIHKRYVNSKRHTMQVDFYPYVAQVKKEMKQGHKRPPRQALTQFVEEPQADADLMQSAR